MSGCGNNVTRRKLSFVGFIKGFSVTVAYWQKNFFFSSKNQTALQLRFIVCNVRNKSQQGVQFKISFVVNSALSLASLS